MHAFESAGLGVAPFRYVGHFHRNYSCEFCGTAIVVNCRVQDKNGKEFIVGSDCILKIADPNMTHAVNQLRKNLRKEAERARIADLKDILFYDCILRAKLNTLPHPMGWEGKSFLNWADWMMENAGNSGKIRVARALNKVAPVEDQI